MTIHENTKTRFRATDGEDLVLVYRDKSNEVVIWVEDSEDRVVFVLPENIAKTIGECIVTVSNNKTL